MQNLALIRGRTMQKVADDFKNNQSVTGAIEMVHALLGTNEETSFGECMRMLYEKYRASTMHEHEKIREILKIFYKNCMNAYSTYSEDSDALVKALRLYNETWAYVKKSYA